MKYIQYIHLHTNYIRNPVQVKCTQNYSNVVKLTLAGNIRNLCHSNHSFWHDFLPLLLATCLLFKILITIVMVVTGSMLNCNKYQIIAY